MTADPLAADDVAAFLRANPGWLTENPDVYRALHPPQRLHGERLADHMAAMLARERAHAKAQSARADSVLAAGRAAAGLAARVQDAVIALIHATSLADYLTHELPPLLGIDAATWCCEAGGPGTRPIPPGTVGRLAGTRVVFRDPPPEPRLLHGGMAPLARVDALVPLGPGALLALASRDRSRLHPGQGSRPLAFLGRAIMAAHDR